VKLCAPQQLQFSFDARSHEFNGQRQYTETNELPRSILQKLRWRFFLLLNATSGSIDCKSVESRAKYRADSKRPAAKVSLIGGMALVFFKTWDD